MASYTYRLPRRFRYRRSGDIPMPVLVIAAGLIAAGASAAGADHAAHEPGYKGAGAAAEGMPVPGAPGLDTPAGWARALLAADRLPVTSCNFNAVTAWERAEGGGFGNQAAYNPLNVNPGPGAGWPGRPAIGAWAFPDAQTGLRYTVATLNNGYYGGILTALRSRNSAQAVCDAIMASPWAASRYGGTLTATC